MERLTEWIGTGDSRKALARQDRRDVGDKDCIARLAAYEDAMPLERAQELAQAEKDGRLVVLPCKDYCWRIRGDIILDIIRANCRAAHEKEAALKKREDAQHEN